MERHRANLSSCALCRRAESATPNVLDADGVRRTRALDAGLLCAPDISPIVPGHTLLFPERHVLSIADYCRDRVGWLGVQNQLLRLAGTISNDADVIAYEHGSPHVYAPTKSGKCASTEHAHIHLLPIPTGLVPTVIRRLADALSARVIYDSPPLWTDTLDGYIWVYGFRNGESATILPQTESIPSQLTRRVIVELLYGADSRSLRTHWRDLIDLDPATAIEETISTDVLLSKLGPTLDQVSARDVC